tara:strand:- start:357 stop:614 length:258 start_codon:yes stop_codon:yes gene_type:complete
MTLEEYEELVRGHMNAHGMNTKKQNRELRRKTMKRKKAGKAAKGMGRAMREANKKLRKANGQLRKGKTQADVARLAHKIRRKKYA